MFRNSIATRSKRSRSLKEADKLPPEDTNKPNPLVNEGAIMKPSNNTSINNALSSSSEVGRLFQQPNADEVNSMDVMMR